MTITLTPEMQAIVDQKIQSGKFAQPGEVVLEGLRLLNDQNVAQFQNLRAEIAIGINQADQGQLAPFEPMKTLERVLPYKVHRLGGQ